MSSKLRRKYNAFCPECRKLFWSTKHDMRYRQEGKTRIGTPIIVCGKHSGIKRATHKDLPGQGNLFPDQLPVSKSN